ncbi:DUF4158 domain-containing protein [Nonomuraea sp. NPDC003754]
MIAPLPTCRTAGLKAFSQAEAELETTLAAHAWNSGDGPTEMFQYAVRWLRENDVLLPGITTLTRMVARIREEQTERLFRDSGCDADVGAGRGAGEAAGSAAGQEDDRAGALAPGSV